MGNDHKEKHLRDEAEKSERALNVFNETKKALQTEERFVNFFKGYNESSVESFITYYAQQKASWYQHGDSFAEYKKRERSVYRRAAVNALREIFIKKLFDLKCRWLAGEMDLPGIETSYDFGMWHANPSLCTFTEPITGEEVNCYIAYLDSLGEPAEENYDAPSAYMAFHHYHHHKSVAIEAFDDAEYIPAWFVFYDKRFGTGDLLKLPVTRMDIECDYHDIWAENIFYKTLTEEQLKTFTPNLNRAKRTELRNDKQKREAYFEKQKRKWEEQDKSMPKYEHLHVYDRKKMKELTALIETPESQKHYRAYREWNDRRNRNESIEMDIIYMKKVKQWIPVEADSHYRNAIKKAYRNYKDKMLRELLPVVQAEYMEATLTQKPFDWNEKDTAFSEASAKEMKARLLAAREWKSEPQNFDFLKKENLPHDRT